MNEMPIPLQPETRALDALIQKTVTQVECTVGQGPGDRMIFLGNRHQSFPTAVVNDPVLEPVDKVVWMVVMLAVCETGGNTALPGYDAIGKMANVSSRSTIARAIAILRATRWLTLCARVRKARGRFRANVYALHDEPLPLADALHLDANYMAFLRHAQGHGHARVRTVAQGVLDSIDEDIQAGHAVCAQPHPIERRLQSVSVPGGGEPVRSFAFTRQVVRRLRSDFANNPKGDVHHDQNSNTERGRVRNLNAQNSNSVGSSSYINKTTTTQASEPSKFVLTGEDNQPLVYPVRLCDNHRDIADRYLSALAPEQRQPVLDELEGRFRAEAKGMNPVYDELSFLHALCKQMGEGKFLPNLGVKVRDGRQGRKKSDQSVSPTASSQRSRETDEQRRKRKAGGKAQIAEMRKLLGMRPSTDNQDVTDES
jgi:hypothetical protein